LMLEVVRRMLDTDSARDARQAVGRRSRSGRLGPGRGEVAPMTVRKWRIVLLLAALAPLAALIPAFHGQTSARESEIRCELVLDIWRDTWPNPDTKYPLKIAVRNLGFRTMRTADIQSILYATVLHVSRPDGSEETRGRFGWRGTRPDPISRGGMATHRMCNPVDNYFTMTKPGRYIVWWTQGNLRSNVLVFDRDEKGLHPAPDLSEWPNPTNGSDAAKPGDGEGRETE